MFTELLPYRVLAPLFGALLWLVAGCRSETAESEPPRPNVILVVFDTTRADDWSMLDPERGITPVLDEIATRGQRFANAWSLYSVTVPSHVSIFTGHVAQWGIHTASAEAEDEIREALADPRFDDQRSSIFTILRSRGYRNYAFSGNHVVGQRRISAMADVDVTATTRPWDETLSNYEALTKHYGSHEPASSVRSGADLDRRRRNRKILSRTASYMNEQAISAMRVHASEYSDQPFLLFLNYNDAHDPYMPEPPWDEHVESPDGSDFDGDLWNRRQRLPRLPYTGLKLSMTSDGLTQADIERARALHLGALAYADHAFGELLSRLRELGLLDSTVIIATADHGEAFGEDGRMSHGGFGSGDLARALLHVPLMMYFPDPDLAPTIHDQLVDLRDIKPTLLEYLGIPDDSSRGRSLMPLIRGETDRLPAAALRPQDRSPESVGDNLIGGQDEETTEKLKRELRELGYVE